MSLFYKTFVIVCVFVFPKPPTQIIPPTNPTEGPVFLTQPVKKLSFWLKCRLSRRGVSDWLTIAYS